MTEARCSCGMAIDDPMHYGYHRIKTWNDDVFAAARRKSEEEFEKRLPKKKEKQWTSLDI